MQSPLEKNIFSGYNSFVNFQNSLNNFIPSTKEVTLIFLFSSGIPKVKETISSNFFIFTLIILTKMSKTPL